MKASESTVNSPSTCGGAELVPPRPDEILRRAFPLRYLQPSALGIGEPVRPQYVLKALCRFSLPRPDIADIVNEGCGFIVHDEATALHLVAYGLCEPVGWVPDAEALQAKAREALGVLVPGEPDTADKFSAVRQAQIRRVVELVRGRENA